jgi:hypothetical protein
MKLLAKTPSSPSFLGAVCKLPTSSLDIFSNRRFGVIRSVAMLFMAIPEDMTDFKGIPAPLFDLHKPHGNAYSPRGLVATTPLFSEPKVLVPDLERAE